MAEPNDGDEFRGHWFAFPVSLFLRDQNPSDPPVSIELRTADGAAVVEVSNGSIRTRVGAARDPDLALRGTPPVILGVLSGRLDLTDARNHGLEITGDYAVLERLQPNRASEPATTP